MKINYHNGIKNYEWVEGLDTSVSKHLIIDKPSQFVLPTFLSCPAL